MATVGSQYMTLLDVVNNTAPDSDARVIIEMLTQYNPILEDALAVQCNDGTGHLTTVRTGLPSVTWRRLYQGVQPSKSTKRQVRDTTGMLEAWSEVDSKLIDIAPNPAETRLQEAASFLEAMSDEMATGLFYHDTATDPEKFMGLSPRFSDSTAENGSQIIKCGGAGSDNTSIWMIVWGPMTCHLLYPRGSRAGLQRADKGMQTRTESDGSLYDVYREKFSWDIGLSVRDWRYVVRLCNIDVSDLVADASGGADLHLKMIDGFYKLHQRKAINGRAAIYCNTTIKSMLHKQALKANSNTFLRLGEQEGREIMTFLGVPIRECDAILNTEATVA